MARQRMIKPTFFQHEGLAGCSPHARLLFIGLWGLADREGRLRLLAPVIHGQLFPFETVDIPALLGELEGLGVVERYDADGKPALLVCGFREHQKPHRNEVDSILPGPENAGRPPSTTKVRSDFDQRPKRLPPMAEVNRAESESESESDAESGKVASASALIGTDIREALGLPHVVAPGAQLRWSQMLQADPDELQGILDWALAQDRPSRAFSNCFDADGNIKTKRPRAKPEKPKRKPMPEGFEEHRADYDWLVANGVI